MTADQYYNLWCVKDGLHRVLVRPAWQERTKRLGPIMVYKDEFGVTYSKKHIKQWGDLSADQQKKAYRELYQMQRESALLEIAMDPSLSPEYPAYLSQIKAARDSAIASIDAGIDPGGPPQIWE